MLCRKTSLYYNEKENSSKSNVINSYNGEMRTATTHNWIHLVRQKRNAIMTKRLCKTMKANLDPILFQLQLIHTGKSRFTIYADGGQKVILSQNGHRLTSSIFFAYPAYYLKFWTWRRYKKNLELFLAIQR